MTLFWKRCKSYVCLPQQIWTYSWTFVCCFSRFFLHARVRFFSYAQCVIRMCTMFLLDYRQPPALAAIVYITTCADGRWTNSNKNYPIHPKTVMPVQNISAMTNNVPINFSKTKHLCMISMSVPFLGYSMHLLKSKLQKMQFITWARLCEKA